MAANLPMRVADITSAQIAEAAETRAGAAEMLSHLGKIARPTEGVEKLLILFARIAESEWIDGDVAFELVPHGTSTYVHANIDLGVGKMQRVLAPIEVHVPLEVLRIEIASHGPSFSPLVASESPDRITLSLMDVIARSTAPPEHVGVAAQSLAFPYSAVAKRPILKSPPPGEERSDSAVPGTIDITEEIRSLTPVQVPSASLLQRATKEKEEDDPPSSK